MRGHGVGGVVSAGSLVLVLGAGAPALATEVRSESGADQCTHGGWRASAGFRNQGDCVRTAAIDFRVTGATGVLALSFRVGGTGTLHVQDDPEGDTFAFGGEACVPMPGEGPAYPISGGDIVLR